MQCKRLAVPNQLFSDEPSRLWSAPIWESMSKSTHGSLNMALSGKTETLQKPPGKSRELPWKEKDVDELLQLINEETIMFSLDNAKTHAHQARIEYADRDVEPFTRTKT